ncbi:hypothetical protein JCM11251_003872 [Rhodosporidiobolus azoricus]
MSLHGLHLPRPSSSAQLPPLPSSSSSSPPRQPPPAHPQHPMRAPPPSFALAHQRQQARQLKQDRQKGKSPFVPRKTPTARGKERDLTLLTVEQLSDMLESNARLLESPETLASLPGGGTRLQSQQDRIQSRLKELEDVQQIKDELAATRLSPSRRKSQAGEGVKVEEGEEDVKRDEEDGIGEAVGEMEDVEETGVADEASSPSAKRRIAAQLLSTSPHSLPLSLSLTLQRRAVARDREHQVKKQAKMELDRQRPEKTGDLLKGAVGVDSAMGEFLFQSPSDSDSEPDEATLDEWLAQGRKAAGGVNGQLDEDEDAQLNPLRTAYMEGWNQAVKEEKGE